MIQIKIGAPCSMLPYNIVINCHNIGQPKSTKVGIIIGKKQNTTPHQTDYILSHFQATYKANSQCATLFLPN